VKVSEVTYRRFKGTSASEKAINLNCSPSGCFKMKFTLSQNQLNKTMPFARMLLMGLLDTPFQKYLVYK